MPTKIVVKISDELTRIQPHMIDEAEGIKSIGELFDIIDRSIPSDDREEFFRGHSDVNHKLSPSLFRQKDHQAQEKDIIRELITRHPHEFLEDTNVFERLVRMQHYSFPTRLLDLSKNPLVALYFACCSKPEVDGHFIRFSISKKYVKYSDSDTISCVANLSNLSVQERNEIADMDNSSALKDSGVGKRLLHFIKSEWAYFLPLIKLEHLASVWAVRPKLSNRRILAQHGAFLIFGLVNDLEVIEENEELGTAFVVRRYIIPAASKQTIMKQLDKININVSTIFPEIENAAKYITSKLPTAPLEVESRLARRSSS